jgi:hypothetical protein
MYANRSSHPPVAELGVTRRSAPRWVWPVALLALIGLAWGPFPSALHPVHAAALQAPSASLPFVPGALGTAPEAAIVYDAPFEGIALEMLPAGARVSIGGEARRQGVFFARRSYWVEIDDGGGARYGFLKASDVVVTAGHVTPLDLTGLSTEALLAPSPALGAGFDTVAAAEAAPAMSSVLVASAVEASVPVGRGQDRISISWLPDTVLAWRGQIEAAAVRHAVSADLIAIVVLVESGGDPLAHSPSGARGLMQVMPGTARDIAQRRGITDFGVDDLFDPATSIDFGAWYLAQQLGAFGRADDVDWQRSVELAAAAYNGGPAHVGQHLTTGQPLFAETSHYQRWVGGMWHERGLGGSSTYDAWWQAGGHRLVTAARDRAQG